MGSVSIGGADGVAIFDLLGLVWCQRGTISGFECSSRVGVDFPETAWVVSSLVDVEGCTNSEKMGNKELRDGCFSFNDGIHLCKWSTVEVARVVLLLYHMNNIPKNYETYSNQYEQC